MCQGFVIRDIDGYGLFSGIIERKAQRWRQVVKEAFMQVESCMPVIPSAGLEKSLRFWMEGLGLTMDRVTHAVALLRSTECGTLPRIPSQ